MNGKVTEKNLFIDGVGHKRNILCAVWVRIQNAVYKTAFFVDSPEIRCTGIKFILNTFQSRCDGCSVVSDENGSSSHESSVRKG